MLRSDQTQRSRRSIEEQENWDNEMERISRNSTSRVMRDGHPRLVSLKDASGREIPASERAPIPDER